MAERGNLIKRKIVNKKRGQATGGTEMTVGKVMAAILAVFALMMLVIFSGKMLGIFLNDPEKEKAKSNLDRIEGKIDALKKKGDGTVTSAIVEGPEDWYVVAYDADKVKSKSEWSMPSQCDGEDCLCFCPSVKRSKLTGRKLKDFKQNWDNFYSSEEFLGACQDKGVCRNIKDISLSSYRTFPTKSFELNWAYLSSMEQFFLSKKKNGIKMYSENPSNSFIEDLLEKKISVADGKISFRKYLKIRLGNCKYMKGELQGLTKDDKKRIKNVINKEFPDISFFSVSTSKTQGGRTDEVRVNNRGFGSSGNVKTYKFCENDFSTYIIYQL